MSLISFTSYSLVSVMTAVAMVVHAINKQEGSFFNTVVYLTSQKINLLVFFNFFIVVLVNSTAIMIWIFFDQIRSIESKYIMDKSQKKIFHFLLLTLILRSTFDVYKFLSLAVLFGFWVMHWLVYKRSDYLVSRGSRGFKDHIRLLILYGVFIATDFTIAYAFYERFQTAGEKMNEIYVIIGFEFVRLLLKAIQDNFKYTISLIELYYREQWTEKGFVFNIVSFIFDFTVLLLNIKLFAYILSRQQFPLYLLGEIIDTFVRLGKSIQLFIQSRQLINKLKRLPDVNAPQDLPPGVDNTCIICLEEIKKAKKLKCGHIFHLNCLRRWLEQNVQCPTCRDKIELDYVQHPNPRERRAGAAGAGLVDAAAARRRAAAARLVRRIEIAVPVQPTEIPTLGQPQPQMPQKSQSDDTTANKETGAATIADTGAERALEEEKVREIRLNRYRYKRLTQKELEETDRILTEITKELEEKKDQDLFNLQENEDQEEEEKKEDAQQQQQVVAPQANSMFKDIFSVNEEDLLDMFEKQHLQRTASGAGDNASIGNILNDLVEIAEDHQESSDEEEEEDEEVEGGVRPTRTAADELLFAQGINKTLFKEQHHQAAAPAYFSPYDLKFGSVPFGLPCIATTRRTLDMQLKNKQIEMINDKICKIMRQPGDYVKFDEQGNAI